MNVNEFVETYLRQDLEYLRENDPEDMIEILNSYLTESREYADNLDYQSLVNLLSESVKPYGVTLKRDARNTYNYIWSHVPAELYNLLSMYDKCLAYLSDLQDEIERDINSPRLLLGSMPERLYEDNLIYLQDFRVNLEQLRVDYIERKYEDGSVYYGSVLGRKRDGIGSYKWTNGDVYIGQWKRGKMHGGGIFIWEIGDMYIGTWNVGKISGIGIKLMANKDLYIGYWKEDQANGIGLKFFHVGDVHFGIYHNDKRGGMGLYRWANNDLYIGEWRDGKMDGEGVKTIHDGSGYAGYWKEDLASGLGLKVFQVDLHLGYYRDDNRTGYGVYLWTFNGNVYTGDWSNGMQAGEGTYFYRANQYYIGEWRNGRKDGTGIFRDGRWYFREEWVDGNQVESTPINITTATQEQNRPSRTLRQLEDSKEVTEDVWWQFVCRVDELEPEELYPIFKSLLREIIPLVDRLGYDSTILENLSQEDLDDYSKEELCSVIQYLWEEWTMLNEEVKCDNSEFTIAGKEFTDEYEPDELIVIEQDGFNYCFLGSELLANTEKNPYTNVEFSRGNKALIQKRLKHLFRTHVKYGTERETVIPVVFSHLQGLFDRLGIGNQIPKVESLSRDQLKQLGSRIYSTLIHFYRDKSTEERNRLMLTRVYRHFEGDPDTFRLNTWLKYIIDRDKYLEDTENVGPVIASKIEEYLAPIKVSSASIPERRLERKEERPIAQAYRLIAESHGSSVLDYTRLEDFSPELRRDIVTYIHLARQDARARGDDQLYSRARRDPSLDNIGEWLLDIYTHNDTDTLERLSNTIEGVLNRDEDIVRAIVR